MPKKPHAAHAFTALLTRVARAGYYAILVPASVSEALGKRGPIPVIATINDLAEVRASLVPAGDGRHRLRLNTTTRKLARIAEGDRVAVSLVADENPTADPLPPDVSDALREVDALAAFQRFPVGKQNHILQWVEKAAMETTRAKRIVMTVEVALRAREEESDRALARKKA